MNPKRFCFKKILPSAIGTALLLFLVHINTQRKNKDDITHSHQAKWSPGEVGVPLPNCLSLRRVIKSLVIESVGPLHTL